MRKADEAQRQQQQWVPKHHNREYLSKFEEHVGPGTWQQIMDLVADHGDPEINNVRHYWTLFQDAGVKRLIQDQFDLNKQYKESAVTRTIQEQHDHKTTLKANTFRAS